jgi:DNA (cytosine-5)-methyltransferase 1
MNELALFAGAGGGILGGHLLGWRTVCAVEFAPYARDVLVSRQNDGSLPPFPVWDDVRTFDGRPWRGVVDVVSGGFPCQDISCAGKGVGITGERSGLWGEMARIIGEVRPRYALVENSPMLVGRGLGVVLGDLAAMGYDARWGVLGACDAGAPHRRERIWIVAESSSWRRYRLRQITRRDISPDCLPADALPGGYEAGDVADARGLRFDAGGAGEPLSRLGVDGEAAAVADAEDAPHVRGIGELCHHKRPSGGRNDNASGGGGNVGWWQSEPDVGRVADGVAARVDRLHAIGNGQVPSVVRLAWETLNPGA